MRDVEHGNPTREFSLHLTLLSSDIIKSGAKGGVKNIDILRYFGSSKSQLHHNFFETKPRPWSYWIY